MGPAATVKQSRAIDAIRARLSPSDDQRFRVELTLTYGRTGKQGIIDAWAAIANGEGAHEYEGTSYVEASGYIVE